MKRARTVAALRRVLAPARRAGRTIGFVPTMGALHAGHASLIARARRETDVVVVSIFVNPAQFGPREDYRRYPRTLARDLALCRRHGADVVFTPAVAAVYPPGFDTFVDQAALPRFLCGPFRPGHFRGVLTVVAKLFNMVQPDAAYFGAKDYQQAAIVRRMARDLDFPVRIVVCPTVRERDGLALSSRNVYLDAPARARATALARALRLARRRVREGERRARRIVAEMRRLLRRAAPGARIDYVSAVDPETLAPVARIRARTLFALAVRFGRTRLIDSAVVRRRSSGARASRGRSGAPRA